MPTLDIKRRCGPAVSAAAVALLTGSRGSGVGGGGEAGTRGGGRPSVVVTVGIGDLHRGGGRCPARQVGCGTISDELMAEYAAAGDLSLLFEGADGRPLWLGRLRRHASAAPATEAELPPPWPIQRE